MIWGAMIVPLRPFLMSGVRACPHFDENIEGLRVILMAQLALGPAKNSVFEEL